MLILSTGSVVLGEGFGNRLLERLTVQHSIITLAEPGPASLATHGWDWGLTGDIKDGQWTWSTGRLSPIEKLAELIRNPKNSTAAGTLALQLRKNHNWASGPAKRTVAKLLEYEWEKSLAHRPATAIDRELWRFIKAGNPGHKLSPEAMAVLL